MSLFSLTKTDFRDGVWQGLITTGAQDAPAPEIVVSLLEHSVRGVTVTEMSEPGRWALEVPVPMEAIGDGVHTFLIQDGNTDEVLGSFALIAGEVMGDDIRVEMALLRAELDMLKRAFRRHCVETT